jgi:hypothetical protein
MTPVTTPAPAFCPAAAKQANATTTQLATNAAAFNLNERAIEHRSPSRRLIMCPHRSTPA